MLGTIANPWGVVWAVHDPLLPRDPFDGYVADSAYPSNLHPHFQPPHTHAVLLHAGITLPTAPRAPFTFVDLGCGDGVGLMLMAAAHPEGQFIGVDVLPRHIDHGRAIAARIGVSNLRLDCTSFENALPDLTEVADYVMAQGVLSWVSPAAQAAMFALAARLLRPGGVLSVGYNAMPGWGWLIPFQRFARAHAETLDLPADERFLVTLDYLRDSALLDPAVHRWFDEHLRQQPRQYYPHEYLNAYWQPHWCTDVTRDAAAHGLQFLADGLTTLLQPSYSLPPDAAQVLARMTSSTERRLAMDLLVKRRFRVDLFAKDAVTMSASEARMRRLAQPWSTHTTPFDASLLLTTPAGSTSIATPASRAILHALQDGPLALASLGEHDTDALQSALDDLWIAGLVRPCWPETVPPFGSAANAYAFLTAADSAPLNGVVGRHGAVPLPRSAVAAGVGPALRRRLAIVD